MKLLALINEQTPEPVKVILSALTFFGVSLADCKDAIQIAVGLATLAYISSKTIKIWTKKQKVRIND